jgi:hypothetical protein
MNNYKIFMESIAKLDLTQPQLEALSNLYKISANRKKINGENIGDIINEVNERMDTYASYLSSMPHTKDEFFDKLNKKWQDLRKRYNLNVPEDNWFEVDLNTLTYMPKIRNDAAESTYTKQERREDDEAQAESWLNMMFKERMRDRKQFKDYLQWELDCLANKFHNRGAGIAAYKNDTEIQNAIAHGGAADLISKYCLQKALMHPFMTGLEQADNPRVKQKYADLSNRMAYIEDVKFNGHIPRNYLDDNDVVWFGWHRLPGGNRALTKKKEETVSSPSTNSSSLW